MTLTPQDRNLLRYSLVFVWLATAFASVWERDGQSLALLTAAGVGNPTWMGLLIWGGAGVDALLGLALWLKPGRTVYVTALAGMLLMTIAATLLLPSLWLHPLGPLTKNLPIAAVLYILIKESA